MQLEHPEAVLTDMKFVFYDLDFIKDDISIRFSARTICSIIRSVASARGVEARFFVETSRSRLFMSKENVGQNPGSPGRDYFLVKISSL